MKRKASASAIQAERLVSEAVGNIAVIVKTKRILLKDHFMEVSENLLAMYQKKN